MSFSCETNVVNYMAQMRVVLLTGIYLAGFKIVNETQIPES